MYEQPAPGHRIGPALIAFLVIVAAAAGTIGYYGARRMLGAGGTPVANGPTTGSTGTVEPGTPGPEPTTTTSGGGPTATRPPDRPRTTTPPVTYPPGDPTKCPAQTEMAVTAAGLAGGLQVLLYIEAKRAGARNAEVWICQNSDGVLIYQGHVLSGPLNAAQSSNTLLLAKGIRGEVVATTDGYKGTNPDGAKSTEYLVSRTSLVQVSQPAGTSIEYTVVNYYPR